MTAPGDPSIAAAPLDLLGATLTDPGEAFAMRTTDLLHLALPGDGARMGRFVLLDRVGAGAMGVVYAAYDSTLDRRVAIKLIRATGGDADRLRIRREAQAMARLSHPNVAQIYEAGEIEGRLYLAMEFIAGDSLDRWQAAEPRAWRAVLDVYRQVGQGLAAAHAADILHRDFKPHNVLMGDDGRPRVIDFGLARTPGIAPGKDADDTGAGLDDEAAGVGLDQAITQDGSVVGTPAYMALEQFMNRRLDARTDQFGFCVALYEALYGQPPYPRESLPTLLVAIERHQVRPSPDGSPVPEWLHGALVRGLSPRPDDRWPSMDALLDELSRDRDHDPDTGRRQRLWLVLAVGALAIGVSLNATLTDHFRTPTIRDALIYGWLVAGGTAVGLIALRRSVFSSAFNRRISAFFLSAVGLVAASRTTGWAIDGTPPMSMYALEVVGLTALSALAAVAVAPWFWSLAAALGIGALLTAIWPAHQGIFYPISITITCCLAVGFTLERRPETESR